MKQFFNFYLHEIPNRQLHKHSDYCRNKSTILTQWQVTYLKSTTETLKQDAKLAPNCKPQAHHTTCPSTTVTDSQQANAKWYVSCYYPNNHHLVYPTTRMAFILLIIQRITNHCSYRCKRSNNHKNNNKLLKRN